MSSRFARAVISIESKEGAVVIEMISEKRAKLLPLFENISMWKAAYLSAIEDGYGDLYVDDENSPNVAVLNYGGLVIYAGDYSHSYAREIVRIFKEQPLILAYSKGWNKLILEEHKGKLEKDLRFHMCFSMLNIMKLKSISNEKVNNIVNCNESDFDKLEMILGWEHQYYHFRNKQDFFENGFPYLVKENDEILSGASAFIRSKKAAECQVNTTEGNRRKGYARSAGSRFIMTCVENGVEIPWDAANSESVMLGKSIGYEKVDEYEVYSIM